MLKYSSVILFGVLFNAKMVFGRFCDGGHRCSAPKECCAQGCCYLYAPPSPPKTPPPAVTDHVLNLFFINHWYFWCVVLAIILTLLCACSLWRKRRQLCGWSSSSGSHMYSEGDSAGSCYAPPQYSRCSSFHHAPPPYTEVTSKPDLYPLVFTCNGDGMVGAKNGGTGYLMVQYFRNYIVRPVGTLSATSTVESLSSSFICTVNEANTIVPPPYSRAASPEDQNPPPSSVQHHASSLNPSSEYHISRSESMHQQKVLQSHPPMINLRSNSVPMVVDREPSSFSGNYNGNQQPYLNYSPSRGLNNRNPNNNNGGQIDSTLVSPIEICINENRHSYNGMACPSSPGHSTVSYSRSEYQLRKQQQRQSPKLKNHSNSILMAANDSSSNRFNSRVESRELINPMTGSLVVEREPSSGNRTMSASTQQLLFNQIRAAEETPFKSITVPTSVSDLKIDTFDNSLSDLRLNLDYTRAHQQRHLSLQSQSSEHDPRSYMDSPLNNKFDNLSYMSNTGSAVSSLVNMDSPRSPPQATSPTDEMRELLEQIRQLQHNNESKRNLVRTSNDLGEDLEEAVGQSQAQFIRKFNGSSNNNKPSSKRPLSFENNSSSVVLNSLLPETCSSSNKTTSLSPQNNNNSNAISYSDNVASKPRKSFYIPVKTEVSNHLQQQQQQSPETTSRMISPGARMRSFRQRGGLFKDIRSPTSRPGVFLPGSISTTNRKYGRLSRSAPTTPAGLPPNRFDDVSPLLDEHEEEEPML